ncbi:hypothetical protein [Cellulosimicrobium sp. Marseille-Q4280]|uniref:hypothetical protein n=1 Tax=Cellulosimicrobium sp. Marseille-Q4280 TaxID=2937992 RepID=UPI00203C9B51|nr:hypothetical protein [Cellulosimicrobium sp. Marseille-Q4280]
MSTPPVLRDPQLRALLVAHLGPDGHRNRVRHEVEVRWSTPVRIDVLAVTGDDPLAPSGLRGGLMQAFEIKSDVDSVARLARQVIGYEQVAPRCWLVTGPRHHAKAAAMLPAHWGVLVPGPGAVLVVDRPAGDNPAWSALAAMSLVVDVTALRALAKVADPGLRSTTGMGVDDLRAHFVDHAPAEWVAEVVRAHAVPRPVMDHGARRRR